MKNFTDLMVDITKDGDLAEECLNKIQSCNAAELSGWLKGKGYDVDDHFLASFCGLMKERVNTYKEFLENGYYFFENIKAYDEKTIRKKWKTENQPLFEMI